MRSCIFSSITEIAGRVIARALLRAGIRFCCGSSRSRSEVTIALVALVTFTVLLFPTLSLGQADQQTSYPSKPSNPAMLDELNIISDGDSTPRTGDVVAEEHTGRSQRISGARLEQPGSQLTELLSSVSGVQQRQSGGFGTFSNITVRAASAAQTAVYLDGILLNSGGDAVIDLSTLEILNLASVDVYKGSTPMQLGYASMGGAVNLNTIRTDNNADYNRQNRLRLGYGSFSYASVQASHRGSTEKWDWTGSLSRQQSDNDFPFINDNATPDNSLDDERQLRRNNQIERTSVLLKTGYQNTPDRRTDLLVQVAERDVGVASVRNFSANQASYETVKSQIHLSQLIDRWHGWNSRHSLYWHIADAVYDDTSSRVGLGAQLIDSEIRTVGAKTYWERFLTIGTLGLSVDLRNETLALTDVLYDEDNFTADRQLVNATTHLAFIDDQDRWMLTPAVRWQHSQRRGTSSAIGVPPTLLKQDESELGVQLGYVYSITPALNFNANLGNYFREPAFTELFSSTGLINGNPSLEPESGINMDVGLSYDTDELRLDMTLFENRHGNLILNSFDARGIGRPRNTGKAHIRGLELSAHWKPLPDWQLTASATFQDPLNQNPFSQHLNNILPGEATHTTFARLAYQRAAVNYWYEWQTTGERYYDSENSLPAAETSLHSIGVDVKMQHWRTSVQIHNLDDENVEDFNGFPKPGRRFFITLTHDL